jgi:hypothetical protein
MQRTSSNIVYEYLAARGKKMDSHEFDHACDLVEFALVQIEHVPNQVDNVTHAASSAGSMEEAARLLDTAAKAILKSTTLIRKSSAAQA